MPYKQKLELTYTTHKYILTSGHKTNMQEIAQLITSYAKIRTYSYYLTGINYTKFYE